MLIVISRNKSRSHKDKSAFINTVTFCGCSCSEKKDTAISLLRRENFTADAAAAQCHVLLMLWQPFGDDVLKCSLLLFSDYSFFGVFRRGVYHRRPSCLAPNLLC